MNPQDLNGQLDSVDDDELQPDIDIDQIHIPEPELPPLDTITGDLAGPPEDEPAPDIDMFELERAAANAADDFDWASLGAVVADQLTEHLPAHREHPADIEADEQATQTLADRVLNGPDILHIESPDALVADLLFEANTAAIYGPPGSFKTFFALDLAYRIANGTDAHGSHTKQSRVLYVAAEGITGIGRRTKALLEHHEAGPDTLANIRWLPAPVNLFSRDHVREFCETVINGDDPPKLIVFDTLARCAISAEENSSKDMGVIVRNLDRIRDQTGACVVIVHHTGKDVERGMRGSNSLLGALDTTIQCVPVGRAVQITVDRQKEIEGGRELTLKANTVGDSMVLVPILLDEALNLDGNAAEAFRVLQSLHVGGRSVPGGEWKEECMGEHGMSRAGFYRAVNTLVDKDRVVRMVGSKNAPRYEVIAVVDLDDETLSAVDGYDQDEIF